MFGGIGSRLSLSSHRYQSLMVLKSFIQYSAYSQPSASVDFQSGIENADLHMQLAESPGMKPVDIEGQLYLLKKNLHRYK